LLGTKGYVVVVVVVVVGCLINWPEQICNCADI
jgi:hypothetical protein